MRAIRCPRHDATRGNPRRAVAIGGVLALLLGGGVASAAFAENYVPRVEAPIGADEEESAARAEAREMEAARERQELLSLEAEHLARAQAEEARVAELAEQLRRIEEHEAEGQRVREELARAQELERTRAEEARADHERAVREAAVRERERDAALERALEEGQER